MKTNKTKANKKKKVILITGASSGFGFDVAKELIKDGHIVYCTARRTQMMDELKELGGHIHKLDVTDEKDIQLVVKTIISEHKKIDVLFNNAGFGTMGSIESLPIDTIKYQFEVNVFGIANLLQATLPHMRKQKSGTIINMSSLVGHVSTPFMGWYAATKHSLKALSEALRMEVSSFGINVVMIEPGAVKTEFEDVALKSLEAVKHHKDYKKMISNFKANFKEIYKKAPGPESTVKAVLSAINSSHPKTTYKTTLDSKLFSTAKRFISDKAFDKAVLRQMK